MKFTHFDGDAFISYAHLDNVELVEGRKGWVASLHRALEVRVAQLLGKEPQIWRDPQLHGNDLLTPTLVERLRRVAALVTVISPRYVRSEWTLRELQEFCSAAQSQGGIRVHNKARVFKVLKTPVAREEIPAELRELIGYEFFRVDPETGRFRELDEVFGPEAQREFWLRLDDLAHDVCALLKELENPAPAGEETEAAGAVFLAACTSDLKEEREALKRELQQHGHAVLPDRDLPLVADEAEAVIRRNLAQCRMSIHLIGRNYGVVPEGHRQSLVELQHELATERAHDPEFARIVWLPAGLRVEDDRQQGVIARLRLDPRIRDNADLLETYFEDLRTAVHQWLARKPAQAEAEHGTGRPEERPPQLYLIADQRDVERITPWGRALHEAQMEVVWPVFDGDEAELREYHEENLGTCDGVLIFHGSGSEVWLRRKLCEVQKSPGHGRSGPLPVTGVCLLPPRTPEKERFCTHAALVIPQWEGYRAESLEPFIAQLKAGRPV